MAVVIPFLILFFTKSSITDSDLLFFTGFIISLMGLIIFFPAHWAVYKPSQWGNNKIIFLKAEPNKLVVNGVYGKLRNPQLVGIYFMLVGETIFFHSYPLLIYLIPLVIASIIVSITVEEKQLLRKYGNEYSLYAQKVVRFVPLFIG
jgi:protein-S-isoprenylcysteine O-methyltransferase Ste14